jgi:spore maturation protein B
MTSPAELSDFQLFANLFNSLVIPGLFVFIVLFGLLRKVRVYEVFVEGAKEGFTTAVSIIPYLVVILVGIALFRAGGCLDYLNAAFSKIIPPEYFPPDAISLALMKPLSGGGARGIMLDIFTTHGVDSFPGYVASVIQGSTETTFYVLAVYFGAVGIQRTRHAVPVGLGAEFVAIVASVILANYFWIPPAR